MTQAKQEKTSSKVRLNEEKRIKPSFSYELGMMKMMKWIRPDIYNVVKNQKRSV